MKLSTIVLTTLCLIPICSGTAFAINANNPFSLFIPILVLTPYVFLILASFVKSGIIKDFWEEVKKIDEVESRKERGFSASKKGIASEAIIKAYGGKDV